MAYATTNPPRKIIASGIDNSQAGNVWMYTSTDAAATVAGSQYFTNAYDLGMKVNDLVIVVDTGTPLITSHRVSTVTTGASVVGYGTVSAGVTIGNT